MQKKYAIIKKISLTLAGMCMLATAFLLGGCGKAEGGRDLVGFVMSDPDEIVPTKEELVDALNGAGYEISEMSQSPEGSVPADRVYAEKGKSFIDISYGLDAEDRQTVFEEYEAAYKDYYILAINGDYVYCIGDRKAFSKAGFTSTANVGIQYINE